jgi:hypothetical protein
MLIALWPVAVLVLGILLWVLSSHPKVAKAGELLFFVGAFWTVYTLVGHTLKIAG